VAAEPPSTPSTSSTPSTPSTSSIGTEPGRRLPAPAALGRYRVAAYVVGVFLLLLVAAMVVKYVGHEPRAVEIVGPIHGFIYAVYLVIALDLALRAKWSIRGILMVLLAGTIPFLSFVAERQVTRHVRAGQPL
jgi:integral membrane protein